MNESAADDCGGIKDVAKTITKNHIRDNDIAWNHMLFDGVCDRKD